MEIAKFKKFFYKKKILITGHTGFKGSWLCLILHSLNCKVIGFSKDIPTKPSFFEICNIKKKISKHKFGDICNFKKLDDFIKKTRPEIIIHLAAQPIVRKSYDIPYQTFISNTLGTLNVLESVRINKFIKSSLIITTDKVYKNLETKKKFTEQDELGGDDPYSSSKSSAELIVQSYISSFFIKKNIKVVTARSGNIIGGGDFAEDRIVPDFFKSLKCKKKLIVRNPEATRPWQNVLDSLFGYLILLYRLNTFNNFKNFPKSWNFGPMSNSEKNIKELINSLQKINKKKIRIFYMKKKQLNKKESKFLRLNSSQAKKYLNWRPIFNFNQNISFVNSWYINYINKRNMIDYSLKQIDFYFKKLFKRFN